MQKIKAFIFDMDGILLDTESVCRLCWQRAADELGLSGGDEIYQKCVGCNNNDMNVMIQDYFSTQRNDFNLDEFNKLAHDLFYVIEKEDGLKKMKGVDFCLDYLKKQGFILAVASSTRRVNVLRQIADAGISDYFKTFTCGDEVVHSKPDGEIYLKACASLGFKPQECAAIEDSPNGVKSAVAAGLKCIMVPDQIQPDEYIKSIAYKILPSLEDINSIVYNGELN